MEVSTCVGYKEQIPRNKSSIRSAFMAYTRVAQLKTPQLFQNHLASLGIEIPFDAILDTTPLRQPYTLRDGFSIGNRFCIHPMEGWDGMEDGKPSELTTRRWLNFGRSGAKLIWGGEATAVRKDGRANPNQLVINQANLASLKELRQRLVEEHEKHFQGSQDLLIGLQLTHSGRFSRPTRSGLTPVIAYHHPYLDARYHIPPDLPTITDQEIDFLIEQYVEAAGMAEDIGFDFVDLKHCHGYLAHELLSAFSRPGAYGGSFENRTRFLRQMVAKIRSQIPTLRLGVRVSAFDMIPFSPNPKDGTGTPVDQVDANCYWFGANPTNPQQIDLSETIRFLELLETLDIELVNLTAGSPYYNPHIQRPALFPPSDGYLPPEDPLVGVARQIQVTAMLKKRFPNLAIVGTAYTYLQEWLPNVGAAVLRNGMADFIGLGRMVLCYPELPADVLSGRILDRRQICRTFSDCTTGPRHGMVSGCYPLDPFYKQRPEAEKIKSIKKK
jgi:NADPH2 dehydrogenase